MKNSKIWLKVHNFKFSHLARSPATSQLFHRGIKASERLKCNQRKSQNTRRKERDNKEKGKWSKYRKKKFCSRQEATKCPSHNYFVCATNYAARFSFIKKWVQSQTKSIIHTSGAVCMQKRNKECRKLSHLHAKYSHFTFFAFLFILLFRDPIKTCFKKFKAKSTVEDVA